MPGGGRNKNGDLLLQTLRLQSDRACDREDGDRGGRSDGSIGFVDLEPGQPMAGYVEAKPLDAHGLRSTERSRPGLGRAPRAMAGPRWVLGSYSAPADKVQRPGGQLQQLALRKAWGLISERVNGDRERSKNIAPESAMADGLLHDLPRDLPTFLERFGTDGDCRAYLVQRVGPRASAARPAATTRPTVTRTG